MLYYLSRESNMIPKYLGLFDTQMWEESNQGYLTVWSGIARELSVSEIGGPKHMGGEEQFSISSVHS